jgi:uncharacterized membrane protein YphA (DoxX/SURF4 family)
MLDQKRQPETLDDKINAVISLCQLAALPLLLVIRRFGTMGERLSNGGQMMLGCAGLLALVGLSGEAYLLPFVGFVLLILLLVHKGKHQQLKRAGYVCHSMYSGIPRFPRAESGLVVLAGMFALPFSLVLGGYVLVAWLCLGIMQSHWRMRLAAQVRSVNDARVEQQVLQDALEREGRR